MKKVILTQRDHDWYATLEQHDDTTIWGCGTTPTEALGDLVTKYSDKLDIILENKE